MNTLIRKIATGAGFLVCGYLVIWFAAYSVIMNLDYRHLLEYMVLGWSGGGEIPSIIQIVSLVITALGAAVAFAIFLIAHKSRSSNGSRFTS